MLSYDQLNVVEVPISQKDGRNFDKNQKAEKDDHEKDWEKEQRNVEKTLGVRCVNAWLRNLRWVVMLLLVLNNF